MAKAENTDKTVKGSELEPKSAGAGGTAFDPIDAALRQIHARVTSEPVPDDFMDLLDKLDRSANQEHSS